MKKCTTCQQEKPLDEFYNNSRNKTDGKAAMCKACDKAKHKRWKQNNPEKAKKSMENRRLKHMYNVDLDWWDAKLKAQNNKCAICGIDQKETSRFVVDHDHTTGEVRDLLCNKCNTAIGAVKEDTNILKKSLQYLNKHSE